MAEAGRRGEEMTEPRRGREDERAMGEKPEDKDGWEEDRFIVIKNFWSGLHYLRRTMGRPGVDSFSFG